MRLTGPRRALPTAIAAAAVLVAASAVAGRLDAADRSAGRMSLDSSSGISAADRVTDVPTLSGSQARVRHSKGTPALPGSAVAHLDIPLTALLAYQRAAAVMAQADQSCGLSWTLLAAIGRVESDHGRYAGARLHVDGVSTPAIRGVALDGHGPVAKIPDTDAGRLDGDRVWDRAVGPMQFLPSTWAVVAVDGDGDGVRSPDDIDDASLATAVFLCSASGNLYTQEGRRTAVYRYNPSSSYVASVLTLDRAYRDGDFVTDGELTPATPAEAIRAVPSVGTSGAGSPDHPAPSTGSGGSDGPRGSGGSGGSGSHGSPSHPQHDPTHPADPGSGSTDGPTPTPGTPTDDPTDPVPSDTPHTPGTPGTPSDPPPDTPSDPPPDTPTDPPTTDPTTVPVTLTGVLAPCETDATLWCLDGTLLDVGDEAVLATTANADFDGDGVTETNADELTGLSGTQVTVQALPDTDPAVVVAINDLEYGPDR